MQHFALTSEISRNLVMELNCARSYQSYNSPRWETGADLMKVLVVEDDPFVRDMAVAGLEDAGFEVIEAATGRDALRLL